MLNAAFASNLTALVEKADLWIHGHMHCSSDYLVGGCRVICDPRGYPMPTLSGNPNDPGFENRDFDSQLTIDV
jgi:hypothetical protein